MWPFARRGAAASREGPDRLGKRGERLAGRFLKRHGCKILARNYHCGSGEVDLIVLDRTTRKRLGAETLAFIEVKTRSSDQYTDPQSAVDRRKQQHLQRAAQHYLARHKTHDLSVRFDIVAVVLREGDAPRIRHIPNAFR